MKLINQCWDDMWESPSLTMLCTTSPKLQSLPCHHNLFLINKHWLKLVLKRDVQVSRWSRRNSRRDTMCPGRIWWLHAGDWQKWLIDLTFHVEWSGGCRRGWKEGEGRGGWGGAQHQPQWEKQEGVRMGWRDYVTGPNMVCTSREDEYWQGQRAS